MNLQDKNTELFFVRHRDVSFSLFFVTICLCSSTRCLFSTFHQTQIQSQFYCRSRGTTEAEEEGEVRAMRVGCSGVVVTPELNMIAAVSGTAEGSWYAGVERFSSAAVWVLGELVGWGETFIENKKKTRKQGNKWIKIVITSLVLLEGMYSLSNYS